MKKRRCGEARTDSHIDSWKRTALAKRAKALQTFQPSRVGNSEKRKWDFYITRDEREQQKKTKLTP